MIRILVLLLLVPGFFSSNGGSLQPVRLLCEGLENPIGIDLSSPSFSWQFNLDGMNQKQSAYEIVVSKSLSDLPLNSEKQWSTGKIPSSENSSIHYTGLSLAPLTRYYWRVRVTDLAGKFSEWSQPAWFETAMLTSSAWKAQWIGDGSKQFESDEDFYQDDRMPLFRKTFLVGKKIESARLYIAGVGYYEAYINGKKVSDHMLDPGWTTYSKEVLYAVHDVTSLLKDGTNFTGILLGNGWFNPLPLRLFGRFNLRNVQQTGRPCVKAEIHIRFSDGTLEKVLTDPSWQTAPGPIVRNNVYRGEDYDARLEQKNWLQANYDASAWHPAVTTQGPYGRLTSQMQPPVRITKILKPVSIKEFSPGIFIADMGQNFAGVARIFVKGKKGTRITLRYGEALQPDGSLNYLTTVAGQIKETLHVKGGPGSPETVWQKDSYVLKGEGTEQWNPRFTFHGFRYIEITGWPGRPDVNSIEGLRMNSDLSPAGEFSCSKDMFNQLHTAIQWTFLSNVFSVQSDCPAREKMGYGGDMIATADSYMYNFDMRNFYNKTVRDFKNEQRPEGGITETAPFTGIADKGYGGNSGPLGWELAFPYLQQQLYWFYGDKNIIAENYAALQKQMDFLHGRAVDGLFYWDISDHMALDPRPEAFTAAAFYYHHALLASEFAGILNKKDDSAKYSTLALKIKSDIVHKYLIPGTGRFDNGTQSAQIFALWYDLSPETDQSFDVLLQEFKRHNDHVSSGIFGIKMMFDVLRQRDQNDLAYKIANQRDFPGWGYMLSRGATTLWEDWKYPDDIYSQNHPMFGSIDEWFYRSLLGINPESPGFKKIIVKPQPAGDLTWAKGSYQSVKGRIGSDWKIVGGKYYLNVVVPPNTTASVWIKSKKNGVISEGGKTVASRKFEDGYGVVEVGSGEYHFESDTP